MDDLSMSEKRRKRMEQNAAQITPEMANAVFPTMDDFLIIKQRAEQNSLRINGNMVVEDTLIKNEIIKRILETDCTQLRYPTTFILEQNDQYLHVDFYYQKSDHSIVYKTQIK